MVNQCEQEWQNRKRGREWVATHRSLEDADLLPEGLVLLPQLGDAVLELMDASLQQPGDVQC
jgi:hypothetical protein